MRDFVVRSIVMSGVLVSAAARADAPVPDPAPPTTPATTPAPTLEPTTPEVMPATAPAPDAPAVPYSPPVESGPLPELKSPNVAAALSLPPTLVGMALVGFGLYTANRDPTCEGAGMTAPCKDHFPLGFRLTVAGGALLAFGPSLGHIYNGHVWTTGLKVRVAALGIAAAGVGVALLSPDCSDIVCPMEGVGALIVIGGAATFVVGAGIEAATAARAVEERNSQLTLGRLRTASGSAPALMFNTTF